MTDRMPKEEDFPSNSNIQKGKELARKVKKITTGTVVRKKKSFINSFSETFLGDTTKNVVNYILFDVLVPAAKNTISEMISTGIEMLLYGEPRRNRRDKRSSHVSYGNYYNRDRDRERERPIERNRGRHTFDDVVIDTRAEAEEVLSNLVEIVDNYGVVSIADFYDLVGLNGDWSDHKYGWDNLSQTVIQRVREGYILVFPKPLVLD